MGTHRLHYDDPACPGPACGARRYSRVADTERYSRASHSRAPTSTATFLAPHASGADTRTVAAAPSYAQQQCAYYAQEHANARAQGAAYVFLKFIEDKIAVWCALP